MLSDKLENSKTVEIFDVSFIRDTNKLQHSVAFERFSDKETHHVFYKFSVFFIDFHSNCSIISKYHKCLRIH